MMEEGELDYTQNSHEWNCGNYDECHIQLGCEIK